MGYELWHIESANLMDDFEEEAEALAVARAYLTPDQDGAAVNVALTVYDDARPRRSLHGDELAGKVFGPEPGRVRRST